MILLSWDGTRHDYPDRARLPGLERMEREGARARGLRPIFPANTFPNHAALATGAYAERHGIVGNRFRDRERGVYRRESDASWLEAEPVWVTAERQGVRAAVFYWVGSETAWHGTAASYVKAPFDGSVPESAKVEQILAWLDLPEDARPRLILSWWHGADAVGHRKGPGDSAVVRQLERQDRALQRLLAGLDARGLWTETTLIVTSDHGMARADERLDVRGALARAGLGAELYPGGGMAYVWLDQPERRSEALAVLATLEPVRAWPSDQIPRELHAVHPLRSGDLTLMTRPPYSFYPPSLTSRLRGLVGGHGYAPDLPEMSAIFYALGRGVKPGHRLGEVRAVDVAPTVTRLLGINPPRHVQGKPLAELTPPREPAPEDAEGEAAPSADRLPPQRDATRAPAGAP
ncbi:MAG: alkaline phosphatase family protein [Myxococcota bacterium]